MGIQTDRREILNFLRPHIPSLPADITSDALHAFLDVQTGLTTAMDEANGSAFDKWRKALAAQGYPVWGYSPDKVTKMQDDAIKLKALEAARVAALPDLLAELALAAPGKPAANP